MSEVKGPLPGDLLVYGWLDKNGDRKRGPGEIGHIGVVVDVPGVTLDARLDYLRMKVVVEATKWVGSGIYGLGKGGRNPEDGTPFDKEGKCDCSGFVCHCLGIDRLEDGEWWNTDSIKRDGATLHRRFLPVEKTLPFKRLTVIHCRGGKPPAVVKTTGAIWDKRGVCVRMRAIGRTS